jgi:hypothetical protein
MLVGTGADDKCPDGWDPEGSGDRARGIGGMGKVGCWGMFFCLLDSCSPPS